MKIYNVKLKYVSAVTANSSVDAYQVMEANLRASPGLFIASVEEASAFTKKRPWWKVFLFGLK